PPRPLPSAPLFPYTTLFRSVAFVLVEDGVDGQRAAVEEDDPDREAAQRLPQPRSTHHARETDGKDVPDQRVPRHDRPLGGAHVEDRKSTRLNSSHDQSSYAA